MLVRSTVLVALVVLLTRELLVRIDTRAIPVDDFVEYWAAGRNLAHRQRTHTLRASFLLYRKQSVGINPQLLSCTTLHGYFP